MNPNERGREVEVVAKLAPPRYWEGTWTLPIKCHCPATGRTLTALVEFDTEAEAEAVQAGQTLTVFCD